MSVLAPEDAVLPPDETEEALHAVREESAPRIDTPLKVVIASSLVLRVAGALTASLLGAYLRQTVNAGPDLIGLLSALFYVTELTLSPVFGAISDLRGRRPILVLGPLLGVVALPIYPFSALASVSILGIGILAFARLIEGVSTAAKVPSALGYLADATAGDSPEQTALRGRVMGFYEISFLVGFVSGYVSGGFLWEAMRANGFFLVSLVYLVATLMLFFFVPESLPQQAREHHAQARAAAGEAGHPVLTLLRRRLRAYASLLTEPALRSFIPAWLAINAVVGLMGNLVQPLMIRPRDGSVSDFPGQLLDGKFSSSEVGLLFGGFGFLFMVGIYLWSLAYGRIRKSNVMIASIAGLYIVCLTLFAINNQGLHNPLFAWLLMPVLAVGILLTSGFTPVALAYLAEISGARVEHRGAVMGLYSVFLGIGQLVGSGGGGFFVKATGMGFNGLILAVLILGIVAGAAVFWLRRKHAI